MKVQLNKIFHKIGVRDRVELANYAFRSGLVKVHPRNSLHWILHVQCPSGVQVAACSLCIFKT